MTDPIDIDLFRYNQQLENEQKEEALQEMLIWHEQGICNELPFCYYCHNKTGPETAED